MDRESKQTASSKATPLRDWERYAACADTTIDPNIFFPVTNEVRTLAKEVCGRCVVRDECLRYAIQTGEQDGIWGGMSPNERTRLKNTLIRRRTTG